MNTKARWLFAFLFSCVVLCGQVTSVLAQDRGNTTAQEYGDAVYRVLESGAGWDLDYNHTAIFAGLDSGHNGNVMQALGPSTVTHEQYFNYAFKNYGSAYYGAYTLNNRSMTFSERRSVVSTAINLVNAAIGYPWLPPICLEYYGFSFDGSIGDIDDIRCDGFVEYCYEYNGFRVWRNQGYVDTAWSIVFNPDLHNDRPDLSRNPEDEASPWAQRGAPCATGPNTSLGCSYLAPDTKMTRAAVIGLPTYQVTTNGGPGYLDVTIRATDASGIHYIGCRRPGEATWDYGQTQPQHPTSDSYSRTVRVTTNGTLLFFAVDNGDNYPALATSYAVTVPPPDTTRPTVTITNPVANARFTNNSMVTVQGTAADNWQVSAVNYQLNSGGWNTAVGTSNWETPTTLVQGTNVFDVFSVDSSGNNSLTNSRNIILVLTSPIVVQTNGAGTVSPNYNGQMLEIGKSYSMTATAGVGFTFTNWTGSVETNNATVNFVMQTNLTLQANFVDTTKPTLALTAPTVGQRWSNEVFTVRGTAGDNVQVTNVWYQLNGDIWNSGDTTNSWTNWQAIVTLTPGTNTVLAYSVDATGNNSIASTQRMQFVVGVPATVQTNGSGTIAPNYNGQLLEVGRAYSMTATAATGFMFTNWTGNVTTNGPTVNFIMTTNLFLTANFLDIQKPTVSITNPATAKTYTNSQTVTISATASDNVGVTNVEFFDGATLKGSDLSAAYTYDWAFTDSDNGAHVWTARAYDAAGNVSTSSPVTLTVTIDITPPTVVISSPTNGANLAISPTTVSGTASDPGSPTSGLNLVEVRVNAGSWSNATGTTSWTRSVTLLPCNNTIEVRSRDNAGNYSSITSNFVTYTPPNTVPITPTNVSPANGATGVSLTPKFQATTFSDLDCIGDIHAASQWQVLNNTGAIIVWDSGTNAIDKTTITVPAGKLAYASNYVWRVRYSDSRSGWSAYSTQTAFTTAGPALSISQSNSFVVLSWTNSPSGFYLESNNDFSPNGWGLVLQTPTLVSNTHRVTLPIIGAKRMFHLTTQPHPVLNAIVSKTNIILTWPTNALGFTLQWSTNLLSTNWTTATPSVVVVNGQNTVTNSTSADKFRFYRLKK